jgi:hypothetical protein
MGTALPARIGTFSWQVNPSSRPHVRAAGGTEAYTFVAETADGRASVPRDVVVDRGSRLDLGAVTVA